MKSVKNFVKILPGPLSYCNCKKACSRIEVDHVIPIYEIRKQILDNKNIPRDENLDMNIINSNILKKYTNAIKNPHNMYRCCSKINRLKDSSLFGKDFYKNKDKSLYSYLARSCLYMGWKYNLDFDEELIDFWKTCTLFKSPWNFERERSAMIFKNYKLENPYIDKF